MLANIRRIGKNSSLYFLGQILTSAIGFFLIPLYTRVLVPGDYGIITIVTALVSIFSIFMQLGLRGALGTFYFDYHQNTEQLKTYVSTIILFLIPYSLLLMGVIVLLGKPVLQPLLEGIPFSPYVYLALGIAFCEMIFSIIQSIYQVREQAAKGALINLLYFVINLLLVIYFVVVRGDGALGNTWARFMTSVGFSLLALVLLRDLLVPRFDLKLLQTSIRFGLPLIPHALSGWILIAIDRLFLNRYTGLSSVGVYSLGSKLSDVMNVATSSYNAAWVPFFMATAKEKGRDADGILARLTTYYLTATFFAGLALSLLAREILALMASPQYQQAYTVVPMLTFGWVFNGMYYAVVNQLFFMKQTRFLPLATFGSGIIQLLLNYLWIPTYGMLGAAWAMFVAQLCSFLLTWYLSFKVYPMHFEYGRIARLLAITGVLLVAGLSLTSMSFWGDLLIKVALLACFPAGLLLTRFFHREELQMVQASLARLVATHRNI